MCPLRHVSPEFAYIHMQYPLYVLYGFKEFVGYGFSEFPLSKARRELTAASPCPDKRFLIPRSKTTLAE
jgi:hypothetical protein